MRQKAVVVVLKMARKGWKNTQEMAMLEEKWWKNGGKMAILEENR